MHSTPEYWISVVSWIQGSNSACCDGFAECLFKLELKIHEWNVGEVHSCLKNHLGMTESTQKFYQLLGDSGEAKGLTVIYSAARRLVNAINQSSIGITTKHAVKLWTHLVAYSWDLIKDIYFLVIYSQFFPISRNNFDTFQFQLLFLLMLSILLPNVLNIIVVLCESPNHLSRRGKILLITFASVSPSVLGYAISKVQMTKEKMQLHYSKLELGAAQTKTWMMKFKSIEHQGCSLARLQSKLWLNEGMFESTIQAMLLLIAIAMRFR